jgi:hypothetical protein
MGFQIREMMDFGKIAKCSLVTTIKKTGTSLPGFFDF